MSRYCDCNMRLWDRELKERGLTPYYDIYLMLLSDYEKKPELFTKENLRAPILIESYLFALCLALKWTNKEPLGFPVERLFRFFYNLNKPINE